MIALRAFVQITGALFVVNLPFELSLFSALLWRLISIPNLTQPLWLGRRIVTQRVCQIIRRGKEMQHVGAK